jgi:hypothetical protein
MRLFAKFVTNGYVGAELSGSAGQRQQIERTIREGHPYLRQEARAKCFTDARHKHDITPSRRWSNQR